MHDEWVNPSVIQQLDDGSLDLSNGDYVTISRAFDGCRIIEELLTFGGVRIERSYRNGPRTKASQGDEYPWKEADEEECS